MGDPDRISRGDWETILHAPLQVYRRVASAEGSPTEAHFRRLSEEINGARGHFSDGTIGSTMVETLSANLDAFWAAYGAEGRSPRDGLKRVKRALRKAPADESAAIREWLVSLAERIADARREMGAEAVSDNEQQAINEIADWVDLPRPETAET